MSSYLEYELRTQLALASLTIGLETEFSAVPGRRFRWDFAYPKQKLLIEVQGGIWSKGGHSTGKGITRDAEKSNMAVLLGYRCLAVTADHIKSGQAIKWIREALEQGCAS